MHLAGFTKQCSRRLSRSVTRKFSNMVHHTSAEDWQATARAAVAAAAAASEEAAAGREAATEACSDDMVSEPERTQFYLNQGVDDWILTRRGCILALLNMTFKDCLIAGAQILPGLPLPDTHAFVPCLSQAFGWVPC